MTHDPTKRWHIIAKTDEIFDDFAPYVPSISDDGAIAYQARRRDGLTGIYMHDGHTHEILVSCPEGPFAYFNSHPDINDAGDICFYTTRLNDAGVESISLQRGGQSEPIAEAKKPLACIGPLGPTISQAGPSMVAFRATSEEGHHGIYVGTPESTRCIADTTSAFFHFQGLPVLKTRRDGSAAIAFRAEHGDSGQGIYLYDENTGCRRTVAEKGTRFSHLSNFPSHAVTDDVHHVAFAAIETNGNAGVFVWSSDTKRAERRILSEGPERLFQSIRGALLADDGTLYFIATPPGGGMGLYAAPDAPPLLSVGGPFDDGVVASFALNPVSINCHGQLAIRILLQDGRQCIATSAVEPASA